MSLRTQTNSSLVKRDQENQVCTLRVVPKTWVTGTFCPRPESDGDSVESREASIEALGCSRYSAVFYNPISPPEAVEVGNIYLNEEDYSDCNVTMKVPNLLSPMILQKLTTPVWEPNACRRLWEPDLQPEFKQKKNSEASSSERKSYSQPLSATNVQVGDRFIHITGESDESSNSQDSMNLIYKAEKYAGHFTCEYEESSLQGNVNSSSITHENIAKYTEHQRTVENDCSSKDVTPELVVLNKVDLICQDHNAHTEIMEPNVSPLPTCNNSSPKKHFAQRTYVTPSEANLSDDSSQAGSGLLSNLNSLNHSQSPPLAKSDACYILPSLEEESEILLFQKFFRNPSSVILAGKWEIPVHRTIIGVSSRLLAKSLMRSRVQKEKDRTLHPNSQKERTQTLTIDEKEFRELPSNYLRIEKPPRAVFEFLKIFYPQSKMSLSSLKTWTEVMAISELCEEYKVRDAATIKRRCFEYLKTIIAEQNLEDLLLVYKTHLELKSEILTRIAEKLWSGDIDGDKLGMLDTDIWNEIMRVDAWKKRREGVVYEELIVHILTWTVVFMSEVTLASFTVFLDQAAGFPDDAEASCGFCKAIKSDAVEVVSMLVEQLRPELQIQFWRRLSDYQFKGLRSGVS